MQLSELFRRGIVLPLTDDAEGQLARGSIEGNVRVEYISIADESQFYVIWEEGIFQELNEACSSFIDDYEEEVLQPDVLKSAITALDIRLRKVKEPAIRKFIEDLCAMCKSAMEKHRPIYFIL